MMASLFWFALALALRAVPIWYPNIADVLASRVEVVSPFNGAYQVKEGAYLLRSHHDPYAGDVYHGPPLLALCFNLFMELPSFVGPMLFGLLDVGIASALRLIAHEYLRGQAAHTHSMVKNVVFWSYLFNPFSLVSTWAMSLSGLHIACTIFAVFMAQKGFLVPSAISIAGAIYLEVYPLFLLVPLAIMLGRTGPVSSSSTASMHSDPRDLSWLRVCLFLLLSGGVLTGLLLGSYMMLGSWSFLSRSYGYMLSARNVQPGLGIFWYFFTEIFPRFHSFFLGLFHGHLFAYILPLTLRFSSQPLFLAWSLNAISTLFKTNPVVADVSFSLCFLMIFLPTIISHVRRTVLIAIFVWMVSGALAPLMWYLWIHAGSGNANFFYFQTLICAFCQGFVVLEAISAMRKRLVLTAAGEGTATASSIKKLD